MVLLQPIGPGRCNLLPLLPPQTPVSGCEGLLHEYGHPPSGWHGLLEPLRGSTVREGEDGEEVATSEKREGAGVPGCSCFYPYFSSCMLVMSPAQRFCYLSIALVAFLSLGARCGGRILPAPGARLFRAGSCLLKERQGSSLAMSWWPLSVPQLSLATTLLLASDCLLVFTPLHATG